MKCKRCGREITDNPNFPICKKCAQSKPKPIEDYSDMAMANMFMITDMIESKREKEKKKEDD